MSDDFFAGFDKPLVVDLLAMCPRQVREEVARLVARIAELEAEVARLREALRNIRLSAARGRAFGHQATPQALDLMVIKKDAALGDVLRFCADAGEKGSVLR